LADLELAARGDVGWYVLDIGSVDRLLSSGGHENFHGIVRIADSFLVQRTLDALVGKLFAGF